MRSASQICESLGADVTLRDGVPVLRPSSVAEVQRMVRLCAAQGVAIVPEGGRTGLVGGTETAANEVILSLSRMSAIDQIHPVERVAIVQAGATLEALQSAAAELGLEPGIDLAARGSATIGGMVSTNAGGVMAFRNGVMRHRVLGIEAVLPDGSLFSDLTRVVKTSAGYDLKHLLIGAEGTLGIVTRVALKLDPMPQATATALIGLPTVAAVLDLIGAAMSPHTGHLRAAEAMWTPYLRQTAAAQGWAEPAFPPNPPLSLILSLGGSTEAALRDELLRLFEIALARHPTASGLIASSARQERDIWLLRENTGAIYQKFPAAPSHDVSVPLSVLGDYADRVQAELSALGLAPFLFGHLADGNLHIVLPHAGPLPPALAARVEEILYAPLPALGGCFSAEHGVGAKRTAALQRAADPVKLSLMRLVKRSLDPQTLMNPGKVLPLLTKEPS